MKIRQIALGLLTVGAIATAGVTTASPAWAADSATSETAAGCRITANQPTVSGSRLRGSGSRSDCANTVTYFWVRIYKVIPFWPDSEKAVKGETYVQNGKLTATGACDGTGEHYTYTSTTSGTAGDSTESGRIVLC